QFDDFGDLINIYMDRLVETICERHEISAINLVGICQGGLLSVCYTALHPEKIRNLITVVTPVDFHADQEDERVDSGFMNVWTRGLAGEDIALPVRALRNIAGGGGAR